MNDRNDAKCDERKDPNPRVESTYREMRLVDANEKW